MPIANRKTFNHYVIGNSVFLTLDSGYLYPYNGTQVEFISNISLAYPNYAKYAVYHNPTYPVCARLQDNSGWGSIQTTLNGESNWVPLFSQYNFTGVFENHVHQL